jgi:hypothetical protein
MVITLVGGVNRLSTIMDDLSTEVIQFDPPGVIVDSSIPKEGLVTSDGKTLVGPGMG